MSTQSFIEAQFPVSLVSKESYKERKANYSQTLTGLGKWWGRKPLVLVRAAILGLLLPASNDPKKDREIFLKLMTMDETGLWLRKNKNIPMKELFALATPNERREFFGVSPNSASPRYRKGISREEKVNIQRKIFNRLAYDGKLEYCARPEEIVGPPQEAWKAINTHLRTSASNLHELIKELGEHQFGCAPKVGDAFCGGGSIPFEAARIGCDAYASDLNPVATLLTWAALKIVGGGPDVVSQVQESQRRIYDSVENVIRKWGIEHNTAGHRADAYLYCAETRCPECNWMVPLAPSWVIGEKTHCIAVLKPMKKLERFDIEIISHVSAEQMKRAKALGTIRNSDLFCPNPECNPKNERRTPISAIRGDRRVDNGTENDLRPWLSEDLAPRPEDIFQERLYCIRWVEDFTDKDGNLCSRRYYAAPGPEDHQREARALTLLSDRFEDWQRKGYLPSRKIEPGYKTDEPIRTRGWTHWHHLFTPRQLLVLGQLVKQSLEERDLSAIVGALLGFSKCADRNSKLSVWDSSAANEKVANTFLNQALNPPMNFGSRTWLSLGTCWYHKFGLSALAMRATVEPRDSRSVDTSVGIWITDPPYADAVNYHELSEFFLAWYEKHLPRLFPEWYADSKRALAITGKDEPFRKAMVDCYRNLAAHMPDNGAQIVMFTHQDASVWADLALILWASGLRVTAAWCIATETESALKEGNYVQGTVLLVLRKQLKDETAFLSDLMPEVEQEVRRQLDAMLELDDKEDPNFGDTDYQLAAYAAALRVLTQYKNIGDVDVTRELSRDRRTGETSPLERIITEAVKVACDHLVPTGFDSQTWKRLGAEERFYLKGLDLEAHGEYRSGAYQELARGFGLQEYKPLMATTTANQTRVKTPTEFGNKELGRPDDPGFPGTLVRHALFAVREGIRADDASEGKRYLRSELPNYWERRGILVQVLQFIGRMTPEHWAKDAAMAKILAGAVENDHA
ncbi:MAG: DUF1156 domain-containing protein [Planctomycetota bacterium]|nr:DUF1156 domain-containing protein [Planctomycetota bacterium]